MHHESMEICLERNQERLEKSSIVDRKALTKEREKESVQMEVNFICGIWVLHTELVPFTYLNLLPFRLEQQCLSQQYISIIHTILLFNPTS
jgi:hypothetical protein